MASFSEEANALQIPTAKPKFLPFAASTSKTETNFQGSIDETPIFSKRKMVLRMPANCSGDFMHLTVSKNWLVCVLSAPSQVTLLRFFLPRAIPPGVISLDKYLVGYKISKLFFDPTGHHLLISLVPKSPGLSADFLYVHGNGPKVRRIEKFKDHEVTAVAFNRGSGTESSTGPILLGTSRGLIFETELSQEADRAAYRRQVYDLGLGRTKYPIAGLELLQTPNTNKYIVVVTVPDCLYIFQETLKQEEKALQAIFTSYVNGTKVHHTIAVESDWNDSVFRFYEPANKRYPQHWGWLCGVSLYIGQVNSDTNSEAVAMLQDKHIVNFSQQKHLSYEERRQNVPKNFILTEFHALLMYHDHITGICLLNQEVMYEEYFSEQAGKLLNIVRDHITGAVYVYTEKILFNIKIMIENRNIWKIYLDRGIYDLAEVYASQNPRHLDKVLTRKANAAFDNKMYNVAANIYANTEMSFEEICLKFMELEDKHPLIDYIKSRLQNVRNSTEHVTMLMAWLIDLYLTQINFPGRGAEERYKWQREYDEFMQDDVVRNSASENRSVVQNLIAQHVDAHNLTQFANANEDYEEVINQHINAENYSEALNTLQKQNTTDLYYKYCPIIMEFLPTEIIEVLMTQGRKLQVSRLIPTLITTESPKHVEEVIKYLEFAIYKMGETNQAIHNYLLRLYAEHKPEKVVGYLENEGHDNSLVHYDITCALIVCSEFDLKVACVFLQCLLRMWTAAVDLALTFDTSLAKQTASKPRDEETCRKLWLRIACHDIKGTNDVEKALDLLQECELLRIEDLMPFFSDFEKIDDFKKPICNALKEYNQKIQELQQDMEECSVQAERVRTDLQNVCERSVRIEAHDTCVICESFLLVKPFFVFPCGHKYHNDCLEKQIVPTLTSESSRKITILKQQLETVLSVSNGPTSEKQQTTHQKVKREMEKLLASDCLYCGLMIDSVDQPLVEDWDQVDVDWE